MSCLGCYLDGRLSNTHRTSVMVFIAHSTDQTQNGGAGPLTLHWSFRSRRGIGGASHSLIVTSRHVTSRHVTSRHVTSHATPALYHRGRQRHAVTPSQHSVLPPSRHARPPSRHGVTRYPDPSRWRHPGRHRIRHWIRYWIRQCPRRSLPDMRRILSSASVHWTRRGRCS